MIFNFIHKMFYLFILTKHSEFRGSFCGGLTVHSYGMLLTHNRSFEASEVGILLKTALTLILAKRESCA